MPKKAAKEIVINPTEEEKRVLKQYAIPKKLLPKVNKMVYTLIYKSDPKDAIVFRVLSKNGNIPLSKLVYLLRDKYKIHRKEAALKTMALECGLGYTE